MYIVKGREKLGERRFGKYIVVFKTNCSRSPTRLYLISQFTLFFPGRIILQKTDENTCETTVSLYEGVYEYAFVDSELSHYIDPDNEKVTVKDLLGRKIAFSIAEIGVRELEEAAGKGSLSPEYIEHDEKDPAFASKYLNYYVLRIRTLRNSAKDVYIATDLAEFKPRDRASMIYSDKYYDYFEAIVPNSISEYLFYIDNGSDIIPYGYNGLYSQEPFNAKNISGIDEVYWWLGTVYYHIFPDSFYNGDPSNDPPVKLPINEVPRRRGYLGGDLRGVIEKLEYLSQLGVEALYLTPIYKSPSYHRYDVVDYKSIDPYLGTIDDFKELVEKAHSRGIKLILDLVLHHTSPCMEYFKKVIQEGHNSKYWDYFYFTVRDLNQVEDYTLEAFYKYLEGSCREVPVELRDRKPFYESFIGLWSMPKWNLANPEVIEYFKDVVGYWLNLGVDGFRIDVAHGIPDSSLKEMYRYIVERNSREKVVILELLGYWTSAIKYYPLGLIGDSAMNYELRSLILDFFVHKSIDAYEFVKSILDQYVHQPYWVLNSLYNLLGSHDTPRIYTLSKGNIELLKNMYTFLFTIMGSPAIYYGDEIGLEGGNDPDHRRYMEWQREKWRYELLEHIMKLIELRKTIKPLKLGFTRIKPIDRDALLIHRYLYEENALILLSREENPITIRINLVQLGINSHLQELEARIPSGGRIIYVNSNTLKTLL